MTPTDRLLSSLVRACVACLLTTAGALLLLIAVLLCCPHALGAPTISEVICDSDGDGSYDDEVAGSLWIEKMCRITGTNFGATGPRLLLWADFEDPAKTHGEAIELTAPTHGVFHYVTPAGPRDTVIDRDNHADCGGGYRGPPALVPAAYRGRYWNVSALGRFSALQNMDTEGDASFCPDGLEGTQMSVLIGTAADGTADPDHFNRKEVFVSYWRYLPAYDRWGVLPMGQQCSDNWKTLWITKQSDDNELCPGTLSGQQIDGDPTLQNGAASFISINHNAYVMCGHGPGTCARWCSLTGDVVGSCSKYDNRSVVPTAWYDEYFDVGFWHRTGLYERIQTFGETINDGDGTAPDGRVILWQSPYNTERDGGKTRKRDWDHIWTQTEVYRSDPATSECKTDPCGVIYSVAFNAYMREVRNSQCHVLYDDLYVATGQDGTASALARVEMSNGSTFETDPDGTPSNAPNRGEVTVSFCTVDAEDSDPTDGEWDATEITCIPRKGRFTKGDTVYIYVIDADGTNNTSGTSVTVKSDAVPEVINESLNAVRDNEIFAIFGYDFGSQVGTVTITDDNDWDSTTGSRSCLMTYGDWTGQWTDEGGWYGSTINCIVDSYMNHTGTVFGDQATVRFWVTDYLGNRSTTYATGRHYSPGSSPIQPHPGSPGAPGNQESAVSAPIFTGRFL